MPDLNTENPHVVNTLYRWVHDLVQTYHVDALRIDTVKHIRKDFWPGFVEAGGVAVVGEVLHGGESSDFSVMMWANDTDPQVLASYQKTSMPGLLDYAGYYTLR
jgi:alpha-amylase